MFLPYEIVEHVIPKPCTLMCRANGLHSPGFSFSLQMLNLLRGFDSTQTHQGISEVPGIKVWFTAGVPVLPGLRSGRHAGRVEFFPGSGEPAGGSAGSLKCDCVKIPAGEFRISWRKEVN